MSLKCIKCSLKLKFSNGRSSIVRSGYFVRKSDNKHIQRYHCLLCKTHFSSASFEPCYRQKKRQVNPLIFNLLASGMTQRRTAILTNLNRTTVVRKFIFIGKQAEKYLYELNHHLPQVQHMQFDDMETFEHSKLKPLSITVAVENHTRRILGFNVSQTAAKGLLVKRSIKKYGLRPDERKEKRNQLFERIKPYVSPQAEINSDMNPHYVNDVRTHFPHSNYIQFKGRRGCVVGQGELKSGGYDPLFSLNHTCAMYRAHMSRLFRRSWNTTKKKERLQCHLALYSLYHNFQIWDTESKKQKKVYSLV